MISAAVCEALLRQADVEITPEVRDQITDQDDTITEQDQVISSQDRVISGQERRLDQLGQQVAALERAVGAKLFDRP